MATLQEGIRFRVTEVVEFRVGQRLIARYRPEYDGYVVTDLNCDFVTSLVASKKAVVTGFGPPRKATGAITTS